jgi:hypothetical protein
MVSLNKLKEKKNSLDKQFKTCFLKEYDAYSVDSPTGRKYITPDGEYPSVTTFLGELDKDASGLDKWAAKLGGKDKAIIETQRCADRGTGVHLALEYLLRNQPDPELAGDFKFMYRQIETLLRIHTDDIYALELPLWSKLLQLGGRVDCIAKYKGILSIIDFKTSSNKKLSDWITNYFLQATCYSIMLEELYGLKAEQLVILIAVENGDTPQAFIRDRRDYTFLLSEKIKEFRLIQSNKKKPVDLFDFS